MVGGKLSTAGIARITAKHDIDLELLSHRHSPGHSFPHFAYVIL